MRKPKEIRSIWDNRGITQDRYTFVLNEAYDAAGTLYACLGTDDTPTSPLGFSQFSGCKEGAHLGARIEWRDVPQALQAHVAIRVHG